ncbi:MAG: DUF4352 domain-containing protein [Coriobacteriia bacterium]|nr:DUF4352 domain-containing protein [Coriobacteriia bacterium]
MQIGLYVDGRPVEYDEATSQLSVGGTPVSSEQVLAYDRAGQLAWVSPDMRNWFLQISGATLPDTPNPPAPAKKTRPVLIVGLVVGLLVLCSICGIFSLFAPNSDDGTSGSASTSDRISDKSADASAKPEAQPAPSTPKIGEAVKTGKFEITIVAVETKAKVGSEYFESKPAEGGEYVTVQWKYKNISKEPVGMFSTPTLTLVNSDGVKFAADIGASSAYATELDLTEKVLSDLNPGITAEAADVFEIAKGSFDPATWKVFVNADDDVTFVLK